MTEDSPPPILAHAVDQPSAFTPKNLIDDVRRSRQIPGGIVPPLCILEFDGDITDWLVRDGIAKPFGPWACFHTSMFPMDLEGVACGIIARTIGGPYAVLIAEQLQAAGAKLIIGPTSAGRVSPDLPLPCLVVATSAIRLVSNAIDHAGAQFDTGSLDHGLRVLKGITRAARSLFATT
jgi:hypothetical protein